MKLFTSSSPIDVSRYEAELSAKGMVYVSVDKVEAAVCVCRAKQVTHASMAQRWMDILSNGKYSQVNKVSVPLFLQEFCNVPQSSFFNPHNKDRDAVSLDKKVVLKPLYDKGYAKDFLESYMLQSGYKNRAGTMQSLRRSLDSSKFSTNEDGEVICPVPFSVVSSLNCRFNTANANVIGFPKEFGNMLTVPDGYTLVWGDFPQIDARIAFSLFLMDEETISCYNRFPNDMYAAIACWVRDMQIKDNSNAGLQPFEGFSSIAERDLFKVYCLRAIYGTVYDPVPEVNTFIRSLRKALDMSPKYSAYQAELKRRVKEKMPIVVKSYFGHKEIAPTFHPEFFCLNSPVQASSSGIIILTVLGIIDKLRQLGYSEKDASVYMVRHDEPIFMINEKVMKDSWVFANFNKIFVESMVPFDVTWHFGTHYQEEDDLLTEKFKLSVRLNSSSIEQINFNFKASDYSPVSPHYHVQLTYVCTADKFVVAFYNAELQVCDTVSVALQGSAADTLKLVLAHLKCSIPFDGYEAIEFHTFDYAYRSQFVLNGKPAHLLTGNNFRQDVRDLQEYLQYRLGIVTESNNFSEKITKWGIFSL